MLVLQAVIWYTHSIGLRVEAKCLTSRSDTWFIEQIETPAGGLPFFVGTGVSIAPKSSINLHFVKGARKNEWLY